MKASHASGARSWHQSVSSLEDEGGGQWRGGWIPIPSATDPEKSNGKGGWVPVSSSEGGVGEEDRVPLVASPAAGSPRGVTWVTSALVVEAVSPTLPETIITALVVSF